MDFSIAAICMAACSLPVSIFILYLYFGPLSKLKKEVDKMEVEVMKLMDHVLATAVPLQLAREINAVALEEAVLTAKADKDYREKMDAERKAKTQIITKI